LVAQVEFDQVLRKYLEMMRLTVFRPAAQVVALSSKTFAGLEPWPTRRSLLGERTVVPPVVQTFHDLDVFWQCVFYSLVGEDNLHLCRECGKALPARTKSGRPSKQQTCPNCRWKAWRKKQPVKKMRARWRFAQAKSRRGAK
jgi:hypothetical protein